MIQLNTILILFIIIILVIKICNSNNEKFTNNQKNIICFLTVKPSKIFYDFCKKFKNLNYDVYICIDDNSYDIPNYDNMIKIIKLDNTICEEAGYMGTVLWMGPDKACSRDKALYYFSKIKTDYNYLWLIEEDVFIPNENIILNIDNKYPDADLLTKTHELKNNNDLNWHWKYIREKNKMNLGLPWACSLISVMRISNKLMKYISDYAYYNKRLFLDEAIFNTIAEHNKLIIKNPTEFSGIDYIAKDYIISNMNNYTLYHPIKDIQLQLEYRNKLNILL